MLLESLGISGLKAGKMGLQPRPRVATLIPLASRPTIGLPLLRRLHGSPLIRLLVVRETIRPFR